MRDNGFIGVLSMDELFASTNLLELTSSFRGCIYTQRWLLYKLILVLCLKITSLMILKQNTFLFLYFTSLLVWLLVQLLTRKAQLTQRGTRDSDACVKGRCERNLSSQRCFIKTRRRMTPSAISSAWISVLRTTSNAWIPLLAENR